NSGLPESRSISGSSGRSATKMGGRTARSLHPSNATSNKAGQSLHRAPILTADLIEKLRNLTETRVTHSVHELGKDVLVGKSGVSEALQRCLRRRFMLIFEDFEMLELRLLLVFRGTNQLQLIRSFSRATL